MVVEFMQLSIYTDVQETVAPQHQDLWITLLAHEWHKTYWRQHFLAHLILSDAGELE